MYSANVNRREQTDNFVRRAILLALAEDVEINREIALTLLKPTGLTTDCAENDWEEARLFSAEPDKY